MTLAELLRQFFKFDLDVFTDASKNRKLGTSTCILNGLASSLVRSLDKSDNSFASDNQLNRHFEKQANRYN